MKQSSIEKGRIGEKIGSTILKQLGFKELWLSLDSDCRQRSYDLLAVRWCQKYAINVKFGKGFMLNSTNLRRLNRVYKNHGYKPAFLFIESPKIFWFYSLDVTFPQKIDMKNKKIEEYPGCYNTV